MAIDDVRFYVGDTETPYLLTDAQITLAIDATSSDLAAAAVCARALAARFARQVDEKFESISSANGQKAQAYERLARNLSQQAKTAGGLGVPAAGGISLADMETADKDTDRPRPFFHRDMFVNPPGPTVSPDYEE